MDCKSCETFTMFPAFTIECVNFENLVRQLRIPTFLITQYFRCRPEAAGQPLAIMATRASAPRQSLLNGLLRLLGQSCHTSMELLGPLALAFLTSMQSSPNALLCCGKAHILTLTGSKSPDDRSGHPEGSQEMRNVQCAACACGMGARYSTTIGLPRAMTAIWNVFQWVCAKVSLAPAHSFVGKMLPLLMRPGSRRNIFHHRGAWKPLPDAQLYSLRTLPNIHAATKSSDATSSFFCPAHFSLKLCSS